MKLSLISEGRPDFDRAIRSLLARLSRFKLVEHIWEESSGNHYIGYFLARFPDKLETYKLRDFESPDAFHLGRAWVDAGDVESGGYRIDPKYAKVHKELKARFPDLDEILDLDGEVPVPSTPEVIDYLNRNNVPFDGTEEDRYVYLDIVVDDSESLTQVISPDEFLDKLDDQDKMVVAKRLYDILEGDAKRWVEYRIDTKNTSPMIDYSKLFKRDDPEDPADWWKGG